MDEQSWDARYRSRDRVFSGRPNAVLVAEAADLPPGRALDAGCGEGADALWLARRGWQVTAVDIARTALERGAAAAAGADLPGRVAWTYGDLIAAPPPPGPYDLVSIHYVPLPRQADNAALHALLATVAPGGTLLFATHALAELSPRPEDGFDPADYYQPDDIAPLLDRHWKILVNGTRPRPAAAPDGTRHTRDAVLRARRPR
ncbi:class I SAM-dependent methyltransferase [Streptomyces sp. MAR4 CNY-716]